jgi:transposase
MTMHEVLERCAGLDVHRSSVVACARVPGPDGQPETHLASFGATTPDLLALRDWLVSLGVAEVAMEATGVYWRPVFYAREDAFARVLVVNARNVTQVPGRKTDQSDAEWLCQLLAHGLLRGGFVPPAPIRDLRDLTRRRKTLIGERQREANRLHTVLEDAGIKLGAVASDVLGASGKAMLGALAADTRDAEVLADLATGKLRAKLPGVGEGPHRPLSRPPRLHGERRPRPPGLPGAADRRLQRPDRAAAGPFRGGG